MYCYFDLLACDQLNHSIVGAETLKYPMIPNKNVPYSDKCRYQENDNALKIECALKCLKMTRPLFYIILNVSNSLQVELLAKWERDGVSTLTSVYPLLVLMPHGDISRQQ